VIGKPGATSLFGDDDELGTTPDGLGVGWIAQPANATTVATTPTKATPAR
jgi:hypothetical protein